MKTCFVDTSAAYAALDANDEFHNRAVKTWEEIIEEKYSMVISNYVIVETTALLQSRIGMEAAMGFTERLVPLMRVEWIDEETHKEATTAYLLTFRKKLSLVDCTSFVIMRRLGLRVAFTFDGHFTEQGFITV